MFRDTMNVEHQMYDYTGNNSSNRNCNNRFTEKFGNHTRKTLNSFTTMKTAILGTSHIIRKVLQCETGSLSGGHHHWFKRSTGKKRRVTRENNNIIIIIIIIITTARNIP